MHKEIDLLREIKSIGYFIDNNVNPESLRLKLADFYFRAKHLQHTISVDAPKKEIINELLSRDLNLLDSTYLAGTPISAVKKANEVLHRLSNMGVDLTNYGFVSLGGGDGTELFTELENTKSNFGLLMEYDFYMVKKFSDNQIPFRLKNSGRKIETEIIECDLLDVQKFGVAKKLIEEKNLEGIVVTIHAVLHELSTRSSFDFNMEKFFRRIYDLHRNIILIIREPGVPENWDEEIYVSIDEEHRNSFVEILKRMNEIHFGNKRKNLEVYESGEIGCKSELVIEGLTKLFYAENFLYEKDEKITSISKEQITSALQASSFEEIDSESFYSESLEKNMRHFGVKVKGENNKVISKPQCFTYTVCTKGNHRKI